MCLDKVLPAANTHTEFGSGVQARCRSQSRGKTWSIGWAGDVLSDYQAADSAEGVPRLRYPPCRESASAAAVAVPLRFLTELHVSAHTRKLDPMFTVVLVERGQGDPDRSSWSA